MAKHLDPESCAVPREVYGEVLAGETSRPAIEPRKHESGAPTLLCEAEGHSGHDDNRKSCIMPCAVVDPEHAGKSTARKLGDLIRVWS
jgi:hypothetical protein